MNMDTQLKSWYLSYPKLDWKSTFNVFSSERVLCTIENDENGFAYFIKGYHHEFSESSYEKALHAYHMGAELLDPLCMFRLHEIYLGNENFKTSFDEKKSLCYLTFGALFDQFEVFGKYSFWTKYENLVKKLKNDKSLLLDILADSPVEYFNWLTPLYTMVFKFLTTKDGFMEIIPLFKALPFDKMKKTFFFILNATFDFLAYAYNSEHSNLELLELLEYLLELTTNDLLFDDLFLTFKSHLKVLTVSRDFGVLFNRRIESNAFWVWTLAFQTTLKNYYLGQLLEFEDALLEGDIDLKLNTSSWLNNYIGYCYEKGLGTAKSLEKSLEFYEKDIFKMQRILFSRLRKIIIMKELRIEDGIREMIDDMKEKTQERMKDFSRMDCYLFYIMGKIAEKVDGDTEKAINFYREGVKSDTFSCLKYHLLANETWRARCLRRLEKLEIRRGNPVQLVNRRHED